MDEQIINDRLILNTEISDSFRISIQERLDSGMKMMGLPSDIFETVYCSSLNKHTCVQQISSMPNKYFLVVDEHLHEVITALLLLFYLFGNHDYKPHLAYIVREVLVTPTKRLNHIATLLQAENSLLEGNATSALFLANKLSDYSLSSKVYEGEAGEFEFNYFLLKDRRREYATSYVENYYVYHELAHIKMSQSPKLRNMFFKLVEIEIAQLDSFVKAVDPDVVNVSLLPKEDIACDAYALSLLFNFIFENVGDYDFEFMVEAYIFAVLSVTVLDTIQERTISMVDWRKASWWRIFIALEIVYLCEPSNEKLREGIIETRQVARNKYDNYVQLLDEITSHIKETPIAEKYFQFSEKWNDEAEKALSIIRAIH